MSSHCADCRDYIAVQTARERADRAIAGAAPDEINFRPIGYATSEIYVGATRFGYIENVATAPQTPMVRCFILVFDNDPETPQTLDTLEDPAIVLRDILKYRLHRQPLAPTAAE